MGRRGLPGGGPGRFQLLERIGMVSLGMFDFADAVERLSMAKAGYQRSGEPYRALQCLANMCLPSWGLASDSLSDMLNELETAAEAAFAQPDYANRGVETLMITSQIATNQTAECQFRRPLRWIERRMALYESLSDPRKVPG